MSKIMRFFLKLYLVELVVFINILSKCKASTHWIVTEDGKIQAQLDSVFSLKRPYDVVALMQQEERAVLVEELKQQLMARKEEIDMNEDKELDLEQKFYQTDADCVASGRPYVELDLYFSTMMTIGLTPWGTMEIDLEKDLEDTDTEYKHPDCSEISDLDFSMHTFEHLMGLRERKNLSMGAEKSLKTLVSMMTEVEDIDRLGHLVHKALKKNSTSIILYNLATYYWRIVGSAPHALECARRALHYSPREYKDVALLNLGNILHRANYSEEAAIVLHAAIDISPENGIYHFTLGNIYGVLEDYNKSAICFENALKLQHSFQSDRMGTEQRLRAVRCLGKLAKVLDSQHVSLQKTLVELKEHSQQQEYWLKQQEKLLQEQASMEVKLEQQLQYEEQKIREGLDARGQDCYQFQQNGHTILSCNTKREAINMGLQTYLDLSLSLQLIQAVQAQVVRTGQLILGKSSDQC